VANQVWHDWLDCRDRSAARSFDEDRDGHLRVVEFQISPTSEHKHLASDHAGFRIVVSLSICSIWPEFVDFMGNQIATDGVPLCSVAELFQYEHVDSLEFV
jgi:hypothetical protein